MKKILCMVMLFVLASFSTNKKYHFTPPGTVHVAGDFYIDQTLVKNIDYREFIFFIKDYIHKEKVDSIPEYYKSQDFNYIDKKFLVSMESNLSNVVFPNDSLSLSPYYFTHPAFSYYPVVNVNYFQAESYCKWRSQVVNILINVNKDKKEYEKVKEVEYYLPILKNLTDIKNEIGIVKDNDKKGDYFNFPIKTVLIKKNEKNSPLFIENNLFELTSDEKIFGTSYLKNNESPNEYSTNGFRCMCKVTYN